MSAMRFFESLAGEASLNKQMANQAPPMIPVSEPIEVPAPPLQKPSGPLDLLTGDDVLDLPQMIPVAGSHGVEEGRVLDLDTLEPADPREVETTLSFPPISREEPPEPPEPMRTKFFASPTPEPTPPPAPPPSPFDVPSNNGAAEAPPLAPPAPPRPRPTPTPIPLPMQAQEPTPPSPIEPHAEPPRVRFSAPLPPPPVEPLAPIPPPPPVFEPPVFSESPQEPARPALAQKRVTPGEMAVADEHAWGDPIVVHDPEPEARSRSLGVPLLLAVVIVALCGFLSYKYVFLPYFGQAKTTTKATPPQQRPVEQPQTPTPAPQTPAPTEPAPQPQTQTPPAEQPETPTATTPAPAPTGVGGFTVQVRSSPNEADAKAAVASLAAAGFEAYVVRADLGARGVWYRVRVGRFESRDDARKTAAKLRSSGGASDAIIQVYEAP